MFKSFDEKEDRRKRALTTAQLKDFKAAVGKCEICGEKLPISVLQHHHIRPKEKGGSDNLLTNVIVVCGTCHNKAHSGFYTQKQLREFLKKRSKKVIEQIKAIERRRQNLSKKGKSSKGSKKEGDIFSIEIPKIEIPKIKMPKIEMPRIEIPEIDIPDLFGSGKKEKGRKRRSK